MRVLVAGSSSVLGRHVVNELKSRGHVVRALSRRAGAGSEADEHIVADALRPETLADAMRDVDVVFSSVGASVLPSLKHGVRGFYAIDWIANRNLADAAKAARVKKFVYVSVFGAQRSRHLAYCDAHERVVDHLAALGLDHSVLRPTAFYSALDEFVVLARKGLVPVFGARFVSNPIDDADLAAACVDAIGPGVQHVDLGGPDVLSRRDMAALAVAAAPRRARILALSPAVLRVAAVLCLAIPRFRQLFRFFAHVMSRDLVAPTSGTRQLRDHYLAQRDQRG